MTNTDSGWRKRQIALDIKAENARELGLDYEPDKELWKKSQLWDNSDDGRGKLKILESVEKFAALVRADEREACAKVCEDSVEYAGDTLADAIRARGQA